MRSTNSQTRRYSNFVVDANRGEFLREQVAQELRHEALLAIDDRGRPRRLGFLPDLGPHPVEVAQVRNDVILGTPGRGGADDDAAGEPVLLAELADDASQSAAFLSRVDLAGHAHVVDRGHEDQEPPGHRRVGGEPRPLGAERLLGHLDDDLLAFLQEFFDLRLRVLLAFAIAAPGGT